MTRSSASDDALVDEAEVDVPVETEDAAAESTNEAINGNSRADDIPQVGQVDEPTDPAASNGTIPECADCATDAGDNGAGNTGKRPLSWTRLIAFGLLPGLALVVAIAAGFLKWQESSMREIQTARLESMQAAKDSTIALLSYRPDTVDKDLNAARDRLTGTFRDSYTSLTHDVVIPGAKQKQISAVVTVPAVASVSATASHAVVLVFVDQTIIVGTDAPTATASSVKVSLDKISGRWLISDFTPV
jgi:Mce-associated membrane protein